MPDLTPPIAARRPHVVSAHGDDRSDDLYWLRDRDDPEVIALLEAENAYTDAVLAPTEGLQEKLFEEIRSHVQETDLSVPTRLRDHWIYSRTVEGEAYPVHCRRRASGGDRTPPEIGENGADEHEQVLLDVNAEAAGHDFFRVATFDISGDDRLLAWSSDTAGNELYTLRFRDLSTGEDLADVVPDTGYGSAWAADHQTFFYVRRDAAQRPYQLWRHRVGTPADADVLVYTEADERFFLSVGSSKDEKVLLLHLGSAVTSEWRWLPADEPEGQWRLINERRQGIEYDVEHHGDRFLIVTNDGALNFRLVEAPVESPDATHWADVIPPEPDTRLLEIEPFRDFLLLHERADGLTRIRILDLASGGTHAIELPEVPGTIMPLPTPDFASPMIRYTFTSLVTPPMVIDYEVAARTAIVRKRQPVPAYDPDGYATSRTWATADDGTKVPVSVVHRKDLQRPAPCLLYGYGSYELTVDPGFSPTRLPLLDRGFVYAIAHIRGGGEMGRQWYEDGKLLHKRNTFTDFVACADHLVAEGWTSPGRIVARGASAGGLLMGVVANLRPELFAGVLAGVPFVDCVTTMLDPSIPLTVIEWEEWGNPIEDPATYAYMKSYSPFDNVTKQNYPPILAISGLNDSRVAYWEPTKWVQRLRELTSSDARILLRTDLGAGHGGPSGRYDAWRREAQQLAWAITLPGIAG